ncbi:hypothetical protein ACH4GE_24170 [Streptomyces tendae]|uniref:hypothetical protein n=1 Tax=Streptomyces tendae TaxID=1932 RepID=UPI0037B41FBF
MPSYLIVHSRDQRRDDVRIDGDDLTLTFQAGWAILTDTHGICFAIPSGQGASIERIDQQAEPADTTPTLNK